MYQYMNQAVHMFVVLYALQISPAVVELIVSNCCNIEKLLLAGLKGITDDIMMTLAHRCPRLIYCSLRNCDLTNVGVCELAMYCSNLEMLALAGIHELTDKCVIALADNCPHLRELYISGCAKITRASVTYLKVSFLLLSFTLTPTLSPKVIRSPLLFL